MNNQTNTHASDFNLKILGHNIKEGRKRMDNMPQKILAALVGISTHTLIDIESGKRDPTVTKVIEIARHLQTEPDQLLGLGGCKMTSEREREIFEKRIEELQKQIIHAEKTCIDLRDDKSDLRAQIILLQTKLGG